MLITALIIGFAGSLHCLGMCSPLALAVTGGGSTFTLNKLLYNAGRITSYGLLGAAVSMVGNVFFFSGFQGVLVVASGILLVLMGLGGIQWIRIPFITPAMQKFSIWMKTIFGKFLRKKNHLSVTFLGVLNGFIPCGLTYMALAYCLTLNGPLEGFGFMLLFGAGTLPAMLGFTSAVQLVANRFRFSVKKFTSAMFIVLGLLLIARAVLVDTHAPETDEHGIVICR